MEFNLSEEQGEEKDLVSDVSEQESVDMPK